MVIYQVDVKVKAEVASTYCRWLVDEHVLEVCESPGFLGAEVLSSRKDTKDMHEDWQYFSILYRVKTEKDLDVYLQTRAPALRAKGVSRWGEQFQATRQIWLKAVDLKR